MQSQMILDFVLLAAVAGCVQPDKVSINKTLRWRLQPGQKFHVFVTRSSESIMTGDAVQSNEKTESIFDEYWLVESVDNLGTAQIKMNIERMRFKTQSPKGNVDIDSEITDESLPKDVATQAKFLKEIIPNLSFQFSIDNRGQILTAETNKENAFSGISEQLSEKGIRKTLKQVLPVLPQAPLAVGDTWDNTLELNRPSGSGFQKVHVKYHYAGPTLYKNARLEKITTEATLDWGETPSGITVKVVSQENPGVIYFDGEAGRLVELENSQKRTITYTIDGQTAREQINTTSRIEINPAP